MILIMNTTTEKVNKKINEWASGKSKLVIGVDGRPGVGKTTLVENLSKLNPNILIVSRDDFMIERDQFEKMFSKSEDKTALFEYSIVDDKRFRALTIAYKTSPREYEYLAYNGKTGKADIQKTCDFSKSILLIDGIFLFDPKSYDSIWDHRIFLKGDKEIIRDRRVAREKAKWGNNYFPEDHPDSYFRLTMLAFDRYEKFHHPEYRADLIIDTTK